MMICQNLFKLSYTDLVVRNGGANVRCLHFSICRMLERCYQWTIGMNWRCVHCSVWAPGSNKIIFISEMLVVRHKENTTLESHVTSLLFHLAWLFSSAFDRFAFFKLKLPEPKACRQIAPSRMRQAMTGVFGSAYIHLPYYPTVLYYSLVWKCCF